MKYIKVTNNIDDENLVRPSIVVSRDNPSKPMYMKANPRSSSEDITVTIAPSGRKIYGGYLYIKLTASQATSLSVYYTQQSHDAETADTIIALEEGDNEFYWDHPIYRIGIIEYDRTTKARKSGNGYITKVVIDGDWLDGYRMFDNGSSNLNITYIDVTKLHTENMNTFCCMFQMLDKLTYVGDLSKWDTSNVTNMTGMFWKCKLLYNIGDISNWDTHNVISIGYLMGYLGYDGDGCPLFNFDLSNWDLSNVTDTGAAFYYTLYYQNKSAYIPKTLKILGKYCFAYSKYGNDKILDLSNIEEIHGEAFFYACRNTYAIYLGKNLRVLGDGMSATYNDRLFPETVEYIYLDAENPYFTCINNEVIVSKDGTEFYGGAEYGIARRYTTYEIPEGVVDVMPGVFRAMTQNLYKAANMSKYKEFTKTPSDPILTHVIFPSTVQRIGHLVMEYCDGTTEVTVKATTPPTISPGFLASHPASLKIYVPAGSVDAYKTAWASYASIIYPIAE